MRVVIQLFHLPFLQVLCCVIDVTTCLFFCVACFTLSVQATMNLGVFSQQLTFPVAHPTAKIIAVVFCCLDIYRNLTVGYFQNGQYEGDLQTISERFKRREGELIIASNCAVTCFMHHQVSAKTVCIRRATDDPIDCARRRDRGHTDSYDRLLPICCKD